jgi:uncharacterized membrane protein (Fun14 family)
MPDAPIPSVVRPGVRQRVKDELWATTPGWSRKLLYVSFLAMLAGLILPIAFSKPVEPAKTQATESAASSVAGFAPSGAPSSSPAASSTPATTSRVPGTSAAFKLGLSFFVGFVVAWILRLFFKIGLVIAGLAAAGVVGLKYLGVDAPDVSALTTQAEELGREASKHAHDVMATVKTMVPSGLAAGVGLFAGWRRR